MLEFQYRLADNILSLHNDLKNKTYVHGGYYAFNISDPKPRNIHKASVRDRLLHHAIYRKLYPNFDQRFIYDSFSCRKFKGTHRAMRRFKSFVYKVGQNNTKSVWILKCDIKKFFASVNHPRLLEVLARHIPDKDVVWLLDRVIASFNSGLVRNGLPLGNLTSQLLANVYMDKLDQFMKHELKVKYYIRYADDFVILSGDKIYLRKLTTLISRFLADNMKLQLHPNKVFIKNIGSGLDFLGWVHFPHHRVLRNTTKRRLFKALASDDSEASLISYHGLLKHGNGYKLQKLVEEKLK